MLGRVSGIRRFIRQSIQSSRLELMANKSLYCIYAETDETHGDCLKEDCGCECHQPTDEEDSATA